MRREESSGLVVIAEKKSKIRGRSKSKLDAISGLGVKDQKRSKLRVRSKGREEEKLIQGLE